MKNENDLNEMGEILDCLGKYVPFIENIEYEDEDELKVHHFHHILLGGDQVTVARVRSAQRMRQNSESGQRRLQGFIPVIEDWHAKLVLLGVSSTHALSYDNIYITRVLHVFPSR